MHIERLPWYKTICPNRKIFISDRAYVQAWLSLLVARWEEQRSKYEQGAS